MGYFTWTAANRTPRKLRNGDYAANCKLGYFGYAAIVCPDDTLITEERYEGIGIYIACENNALIPFPIKIVDCKRPKPYAELRPSISTQ